MQRLTVCYLIIRPIKFTQFNVGAGINKPDILSHGTLLSSYSFEPLLLWLLSAVIG